MISQIKLFINILCFNVHKTSPLVSIVINLVILFVWKLSALVQISTELPQDVDTWMVFLGYFDVKYREYRRNSELGILSHFIGSISSVKISKLAYKTLFNC